MKIDSRCPACLLSRVQYEAELSTDDKELIHRTVKESLKVLNSTYAPGVPAGYVSTAVHRKAYEVLEDTDPYRKLKELSNRTAMSVMEIANSYIYRGNPDNEELFRRAVLSSVIGNTFDFGVMGFDVAADTFDSTFSQLFEKGLDIDDTSHMIEMLDDVVYVVDNCGEILFDMIVFDTIKKIGGNITLVVRGGPMLTDVTMTDVNEFKIDKKVDKILTTGSNAVGVCFDEAPPELLRSFDRASLVISKGMANYETISESDVKPVAYLLRTKCKSVAEDLNVDTDLSIAKLIK
ncbi:damage-control phosphatase ARMT1 family protein [Methanosalsum zhilinae]|nr:ARMT1-like domain-containing protein [Methanosalsum zhilinae]